MKTILTIFLIVLLSFSSHSQIDSIKSHFKLKNITNIFKKKTTSSIQNRLVGDRISIKDSSFIDTTSIRTVKLETSTKPLKRDTLLVSNDTTTKIVVNEFIKKMKFPVDTSQKSINIFIVGSSNVDLNISSGGMLTVNKTTPAFNGQLLNSMLNGEVKKKGFLSDMDAGKLTSLVTLILASLPLIISSFK